MSTATDPMLPTELFEASCTTSKGDDDLTFTAMQFPRFEIPPRHI